jgi:hypothetical protein
MLNKLTKIIESNQENVSETPRDYIGASSIGSECLRQIWYQFKGYSPDSVPSQVRRTWDIGKNLESLVIKWLNDAGVLVEESQQKYSSSAAPFFQGHFDGLVTLGKTKSILEIKTAKNTSFNLFKKNGVMSWNNQYYSQIQSYMGMSGINSAYILVLNKDNSELCDELVKFNGSHYEALENKALLISSAVIMPPRINGSPLFFKCKMCGFNKECHK